MSSITTMVIFTRFQEADAMERLNGFCIEVDEERHQHFERLNSDAAGGTKWFTSNVWAMAGNYFPSERLIEALPSFDWMSPEDVVLIVRHEDDDFTHVYRAEPTDTEEPSP